MQVRDILDTINRIDKIVDVWESKGLTGLTFDDVESLIYIAQDHKDELLDKKVIYKEKENG